jgi:hypothetical protein
VSFDQTVNSELRTMEQRVEAVLRDHPKARDNDTYLEWLLLRDYLRTQGFELPWIEYEVFRVVCNFKFETVRRVRQKIQARGLYPASEPVQARRAHKQDIMRDWAGKKIAPGSWD